ncbi:MAG: hypothetical protein CMB80_01800 [Flammeovirgaceae bacterium]|nr:hypothetical protein [Flammeovirgaceae bacterium]|tara:strand:- start:1500 stop:2084 length:585 start_codon:yes stop_codon:yes gene_type:complete
MKYSEIRSQLKTGDIVLFSGKGRISNIIKWFTKSPWSHVGMVIKSKEWDTLLLWESTTLSKLKDISTGKARQGVQLVPLSERIKTYEGSIGIRKVKGRGGFNQQGLIELRAEVKGRPYEESKIELLKSAYDGPLGQNEEDLSSLFCSELVAEAYQRMGLLTETTPSNEFTPADFGGDIALLGAAYLGDIVEVEA